MYTHEGLSNAAARLTGKIELPRVQTAYDAMQGLLKPMTTAKDLQLTDIPTNSAHGIDAEKDDLIKTLNTEQAGAKTASEQIERWEELEKHDNLRNLPEDKAKVDGGIVVDGNGKRTGKFYWKDTGGTIHGPDNIEEAYTNAIRGLRRQKVDGEDKTGIYDVLSNGDAVGVEFVGASGLEAKTLQEFDKMVTTKAAEEWDKTHPSFKFADLQKKYPKLAHAYARKIENDSAKNTRYFFMYAENKTNTAPKLEEKDPAKRAEYASAAASEILNVSVVDAAKDLSKVRQNYSFGLLAQYNSMLKEARDTGNTQLVEFLTPIVTSAARECFQQNPHVFDRNHTLLSNLDLSKNYYDQNGDLVTTTVRDILVSIGIPPATTEQIRSGLHPHRLVALISSMSQKTAENPRHVAGIIKRLTTEGILVGEEGNAIETMCNHGWLADFRKSLAAHLGVKPEQLQNPEDFMKQHIDDILKDAAIQNPNESHRAACHRLADYTNEILGKPTFNGFRGRAAEFFQANLGKMIFIGMALQILQAQFDKDMQASSGQGGGAPE